MTMLSGSSERWIGEQQTAVAIKPSALGRLALPSLRLRVSERKLLLFVADLLLINASLALALSVRGSLPHELEWGSPKWYVSLSIIWLACAVFFDVYDLADAARPVTAIRRIVSTALVATLIYTFTPWFTPPLGARSLTYLFMGVAVCSLAGWRLFYAVVFVQPWFSPQALVVGAGAAGRELADALRANARTADAGHTSYRLTGYIDANPAYWGSEVCDLPVWGGHDMLLPLVERLHIDEVVLAITHRHAIGDDLLDALLRCTEQGVHVTTMSLLYERLLGRIPVDHLGRDLPRVMDMEESVSDRVYSIASRLADMALALVGMVILALTIPWVWVANAWLSPGPLFYRQLRVGCGGQPFFIIKFRTMRPDAEKSTGAVWASSDDPRITPVGRWLRRTRLDELPQFLNVLRGEMSIIGPRPERPEFVAELARTIPFYRARHSVRPGLTGWAQVQYHYASSVDDARVKLEYDLYYIKHQGPLLDLQILIKTLAVMLQLRGM
jgi:exopolysaccharide biosynthesis polyprenyl glycosylphosphotransferase